MDKPAQQSTAASTLLLLQANSRVWRPPEQKPIAPILPVRRQRAKMSGRRFEVLHRLGIATCRT